jgi:aspartyl-tRNA(Asn)/glutamyl-tRNA(Gln) amidotransferase subunit C
MDIKDVEKLAELARIALSEEEKVSLLSDMQEILAYVKMIEKAELSEIAPALRLKNIWREDSLASASGLTPDFSMELITGQFPEDHDGFLKVKKIL